MFASCFLCVCLGHEWICYLAMLIHEVFSNIRITITYWWLLWNFILWDADWFQFQHNFNTLNQFQIFEHGINLFPPVCFCGYGNLSTLGTAIPCLAFGRMWYHVVSRCCGWISFHIPLSKQGITNNILILMDIKVDCRLDILRTVPPIFYVITVKKHPWSCHSPPLGWIGLFWIGHFCFTCICLQLYQALLNSCGMTSVDISFFKILMADCISWEFTKFIILLSFTLQSLRLFYLLLRITAKTSFRHSLLTFPLWNSWCRIIDGMQYWTLVNWYSGVLSDN